MHFLCGVFRSFTITGSTPYRQNFPVWCRVTCSFSTAVHLHWDSCVVFAFFENHTFVSETRYLVPSDTFYVVLVSHKFDWGLSRLLNTELHWLDVPELVVYKLGVMVFNCLHGQSPPYLVELCQPVVGVASRQHLWSATRQLLVLPHHLLSFYGRRAFCVAGPSVWNPLPDSLQNPIIGGNSKQFQTISEDVSVCNVLMHSAH